MFEFRPNLPIRREIRAKKERKREILIQTVSEAKTLRKLRETLLQALEEGDL